MKKKLFEFIWRRQLKHFRLTVVRVTGWNSCLADTKGGERIRAWFMPFDRNWTGIFKRNQ